MQQKIPPGWQEYRRAATGREAGWGGQFSYDFDVSVVEGPP